MPGRSDSIFWDIHSGRTSIRGTGESTSDTVRGTRAWAESSRKVDELLERRNGAPWEEVCQKLNQKLRGWRQYFNCGSKGRAYKAVDEYVYDRVRNFLRRRHKVSSQGTRQFPMKRIFGELGVFRLRGPLRDASS